jgi:diguanylate cyclase (GGDEF)-like protein/PAS domain S-box-containing protein
MQSKEAINLLVIEESLSDTDTFATILRNAGYPTHPTRLDDIEQLEEMLKSDEEFDMIFYGEGTRGVDMDQAISLATEHRPDVPFIVIAKKEKDEKLMFNAMRLGAKDVVIASERDHLHLASAREINAYRDRQKLESLRKQLRETEGRATLLVENSRDAIAYVHEGMYIHANKSYLDMFGYVDMDDLMGMPIMDMVAPEDIKPFKAFLRALGRGKNEENKLSLHCRSSDGNTFDAEMEFSAATIEGEPCTQVIIHDRSDSKELEKKLRQLSAMDSLTGLPNRDTFLQKLEEITELPENSRKPQAMFYMLIDNLQEIRSKGGVNAGDAALKEIAEIIEAHKEEGDYAARFGEHSFTILTGKGNSETAKEYAEKIRLAVDDHLYQSVGQALQPTCSIGISIFSAKSKDPQALINQGYNACSSAHSDGGNQVALYDAAQALASKGKGKDADAAGVDDSQMREMIEYAIDHDKFKLVYQPLVSLEGDSRENYQVLLRLLDNKNQEIFPENFLTYAERGELMGKVDRWVISHAVTELVKQRKDSRKVVFFITLSAQTINDDSLLLWICDCLRDMEARGAWLTFQIHEEDMRAHTQKAKKLMEGLKKIGCQLAVDRFGRLPKYETLLKHLPIDYVKMDKHFANGLATDQKRQDELTELASAVREFDMKSVAVGVEDANSLAVLWTIGVNYIQGYYLQEPSENINFDFSSF